MAGRMSGWPTQLENYLVISRDVGGETRGFEPWGRRKPTTISRPPHSTTLPSPRSGVVVKRGCNEASRPAQALGSQIFFFALLQKRANPIQAIFTLTASSKSANRPISHYSYTKGNCLSFDLPMLRSKPILSWSIWYFKILFLTPLMPLKSRRMR